MGKHKRLCMRACVGLLGVRLEKYRLFYVALTLCFTVSFVGGWLNESFGLGLRYQKLWFGLGLGGGGADVKGEGKANLYLWLLDSMCIRLHRDASLPLSAACCAEHVRHRRQRMLAIILSFSVQVLSDMCLLSLYRGGSYRFVKDGSSSFWPTLGSRFWILLRNTVLYICCVKWEGFVFQTILFYNKPSPRKIMDLLAQCFSVSRTINR